MIYSLSPLFLLLAMALVMHSRDATAGVKSVERTLPRYGQRGTTVEVEIQGVSLNQPREIIFFKPGIRAFDLHLKEDPPQRRSFAHGAYLDAAITCKFEIAPDCPPGQYAFRLLTATELSHIGTFHVSPFPTIAEAAEPNDLLQQAMPVATNITVNGMLGRDPEDYFRVAVKAGQRLAVELDSVRIADQGYGGSEFDLAVRILNADGREIASNDDNALHLQDPVIAMEINYDGDAFVVVRRSVNQPQQTPYAIHIGTNRRALVAFPPGGPSGKTQSLRMIGDPGGDFEVDLAIPESAGDFEYFGEAPSGVPLRSSPFANLLESSDGTDTPVQQLPIALNGIIDRHDDIDRFLLSATKDQPLHVRVFSAALGSPIDPLIRIRNAAGEIELLPDDASLPDRDVFGTSYRAGGGRPEILDPSIIWTPKADGDYVLEIADSSGAGGPTGVYRVEIQAPRTLVQTVLWSRTFDWAESTRVTGLAIPQEGRWTVNVSLPNGQWNRPTGEFDLIAHGLPEGVRLVSPRIKPGVSLWPVQFEANADAKPGGAVIMLSAKSAEGTSTIISRSQENIPFLNHSGGDALHHVQVDRYVLGVTDPAPFTLDIEPPRAALVRGGELAIPVKIKRREGFVSAVEYWVGFVDGAISPQPPTTIAAGETASILRLSASASAPLGDQPLVVLGRSLEGVIPRSLGAGDRRTSSEIVTLTVAEPYVELASQPANLRRGERKAFAWTVKHKTPFEGEARVQLLGLPKGVSTIGDDPRLTKESNEVVFELEATGEALLGQVTGLGCEILVSVAGQEVAQRTGRGTLRIDPFAAADSGGDK
ncbi:MAG: hypothetical protein ACI9NC_002258 [Verrucomicrobiales bacterium]|jgi:hypothetical protein